jgi:hypothetical protein
MVHDHFLAPPLSARIYFSAHTSSLRRLQAVKEEGIFVILRKEILDFI